MESTDLSLSEPLRGNWGWNVSVARFARRMTISIFLTAGARVGEAGTCGSIQ